MCGILICCLVLLTTAFWSNITIRKDTITFLVGQGYGVHFLSPDGQDGSDHKLNNPNSQRNDSDSVLQQADTSSQHIDERSLREFSGAIYVIAMEILRRFNCTDNNTSDIQVNKHDAMYFRDYIRIGEKTGNSNHFRDQKLQNGKKLKNKKISSSYRDKIKSLDHRGLGSNSRSKKPINSSNVHEMLLKRKRQRFEHWRKSHSHRNHVKRSHGKNHDTKILKRESLKLLEIVPNASRLRLINKLQSAKEQVKKFQGIIKKKFNLKRSPLIKKHRSKRLADKSSHSLDSPDQYNHNLREYTRAKNLIICGTIARSQPPLVVLTMSIYHRADRQFIFSNTLSNWAALSALSMQILPVVYVSDQETLEKSGVLIHKACQLGWVVAYVSQCNPNGFPVLSGMLAHSRAMWPRAKWIGFANADILMYKDLVETLRYFSTAGTVVPDLLVARRWDIHLSPEDDVSDLKKMELLKLTSDLHPVTGIDLFIFNSRTFPFESIPPFVIGRPAYDNWIVYFSLLRKLVVVDVTHTVTCLHQGVVGRTVSANSYNAQTTDLKYNFRYMEHRVLKQGFIDCIPQYTNFSVVTTNRAADNKKSNHWRHHPPRRITLRTREPNSLCKPKLEPITLLKKEQSNTNVRFKSVFIFSGMIIPLMLLLMLVMYKVFKAVRQICFPYSARYYKLKMVYV